MELMNCVVIAGIIVMGIITMANCLMSVDGKYTFLGCLPGKVLSLALGIISMVSLLVAFITPARTNIGGIIG